MRCRYNQIAYALHPSDTSIQQHNAYRTNLHVNENEHQTCSFPIYTMLQFIHHSVYIT